MGLTYLIGSHPDPYSISFVVQLSLLNNIVVSDSHGYPFQLIGNPFLLQFLDRVMVGEEATGAAQLGCDLAGNKIRIKTLYFNYKHKIDNLPNESMFAYI